MSGKNNANTVQGTNDSSIVSKHAMIEAGYAQDPFLQAFTLKTAPRRAPLINRGYYIRTKAIRDIIRSFLTCDKNPKQIISLGAGFDTTYFSLLTADDTADLFQTWVITSIPTRHRCLSSRKNPTTARTRRMTFSLKRRLPSRCGIGGRILKFIHVSNSL